MKLQVYQYFDEKIAQKECFDLEIEDLKTTLRFYISFFIIPRAGLEVDYNQSRFWSEDKVFYCTKEWQKGTINNIDFYFKIQGKIVLFGFEV